MKELVKGIRTAAGLSQQEFADVLGVTFAAVNRWENGHATPNRLAQSRIYDFCQEKGISLMDLILEKIGAAVSRLSLPDNRIILYHGSKSGIVGNIAPVSRDRCDFGRGFYMGTQPDQPLTLICDFEKSRFYVVSLNLENLNVLRVPADIEWAMLVAYHRGKMEKIQGIGLYNKYRQMLENVDVVIGSIANDRMFYVLDNFFLGNITDTALVNSLSALQLGEQYVCVTQKACNEVRIEAEIPVSALERRCLQDVSAQSRARGIALANDICKNHRREGRFFDEILDDPA